MLRHSSTIALVATLFILGTMDAAHAQRGRGGGGRGGGGRVGGGGRPGGGMARPAGGMSRPGGMARPSRPTNRPAMGGMNRPAGGGNMSRPGMGNFGNRPGGGGFNRPGQGGIANRPGGGMNRPGQIGGGNRPGIGGNFPGGGNRPGIGGNRPGGGNFPGGANRPGIGGNRPGGGNFPGGGNRPGWANRPGGGGNWAGIGGGNRPGLGNRPGAGGGGEQWRPGGGNRPTPPIANRPGWGGGGEQWRPGGGNRPGWGGNWPGGGNRPGWGNGNIGSGNIGSGNIGQIGNNVGFGGGNTSISNISNFGGNYSGGGWGGGWGGYGGGWGGGYGGWGGYGGGWAAPYYGNWYHGWGSNLGSFWGGFGLGALTSWGLGSMFGAASYYSALGSYGYGGYGYPVYGGYGYGTGYGVYDYFPTWGVSSVGNWGLGSLATTWLSSNYINPYNTVVVASQPAATPVVYDYSQPINVTAAPPDPSAADSTEQVFSAARDAFQAGDYQRALDLADQVIKATPNAPVVHEFRALCLFALKRYDEAASVAYAVLSAGPCWDWSTLVGLYANADTYTNQLRALEAAVRSNPSATPPRFLLAYHYLVQGNSDAAGSEFAIIAKSEPKDQLSQSFAKALTKAKETTASPATAVAQAGAGAQPAQSGGRTLIPTSATVPTAPATGTPAPTAAAPAAGTTPSTPPAEAPPPPPAELTGTWKAAPSPDTAITLALQADGAYTWNVVNKGQQQQSITGRAAYVNDVLSLTQEQGPPLAGKIESKDAGKFVFRLMGGGTSAPALTFTR